MPPHRRALILLACLLVAGVASLAVTARAARPAHWPTDATVFALDDWRLGPLDVQTGDGDKYTGALLRRVYWDDAGRHLTLDVWSNPVPQAKMLFRKGPDRDFLGAGYLTEPVGPELAPARPDGGALIARRGPDAWFLVYSYGEKRGLLGNGVRAWIFAEWDALLDAPNDYFMARVMAPYRGDKATVRSVLTAADTLFPRLAAWYANASA